jgi:hypothetical protein
MVTPGMRVKKVNSIVIPRMVRSALRMSRVDLLFQGVDRLVEFCTRGGGMGE